MKARSLVLYASLALNIALLILVSLPKGDSGLVFGQSAVTVGNYAAVSAKGGGPEQALWVANRAFGQMAVFQYQLGGSGAGPIQLVNVRDLRTDFEERQIGNLMLVTADRSDAFSNVYAIDTDSNKMVVYEYNRSNRTVDGIQKNDLSAVLSPAARASEPEIVGSVRFSNQVHQAMLLLKTRDADAYAIVVNYVGRIQEGERSGMWAYRTPPTYEMSDASAFYSLTWCAATIAHDSFHSKLYHDYLKANDGPVPDAVWTGTAAEQECMNHQLAVMERIGATKREIDYAKTQADGHYVKDNETWEDYEKRTW